MNRKAKPSRITIVTALGTTQTLAWASSYYLLAILADPIAQDLNTSGTAIFAAFSASLVISALLGPKVGRTIDLLGGREVLAVSNLLFAAGLALLGLAHTLALFWLGWLLLGIAMGLGLYDAAFATLGRIAAVTARDFIEMKGGLPIVVDGQVIGGIGASFDTPDHDAQIAQAGLDALSQEPKQAEGGPAK